MVHVHWFRRDLRIEDNHALSKALESGISVLPIFIFDDSILENLPKDDHRVNFIYDALADINKKLKEHGKSLLVLKGKPVEVWKKLLNEYKIDQVSYNRDYEPYALQRDKEVQELLKSNGVTVHNYKDQVIFEENDILKGDNTPYTVYTPYKNKWLAAFKTLEIPHFDSDSKLNNCLEIKVPFPSKKELGIQESSIVCPPLDLSHIDNYGINRDYPAKEATTKLGVYLRFGTVSTRKMVKMANAKNEVFLSELIWREFFMQILFHFPHVVTKSFKAKYDAIVWENDETLFEKWKEGKTGYPMVDAGMRELNATGFMHNRTRMVVASFLCKHLLIDWRWGEAYFAEKLFDYDLSANNGNWQWAAGCGCDAAPYFRVFNPETQFKKFDEERKYVKKWVPEYADFSYCKPIVEHSFARLRAIDRYKEALQ